MAHDDGHREDLVAEATALVRRAEFVAPAADRPNDESPLVAGFRRDGSLSVYFGEDPVYQFNTEGRLRRAFVAGLLFRTQGSTLAQLTRDRSSTGRVELLRHDLDDSQLAAFREVMKGRIIGLLEELRSDRLNQAATAPESADVKSELIAMLEVVLAAEPWLASPFAGKR